MTTQHWEDLLTVISGGKPDKAPIGFIIDSPWIPGWYGVSTMDYYSNDSIWFEANKKAIETFPEAMFLPGFWSEYGMCTEPSAFGAKCVWAEQNLPHANKIISDISEAGSIKKPNVKTDGLLPFMISRLKHHEKAINEFGHEIKFAVTRGPLNIATFLMGTTEFLMALAMYPDETQKFIKLINDFIKDWVEWQLESFPGIEGILMLDDIVGFLSEDDFNSFAKPYLKDVYGTFDCKVNFFHNDAQGIITSQHLQDIGVNLFNFSFEHSISEIKSLTNSNVALLGNIPPRDVLALGSVEDVKRETRSMIESVDDHSGIIWSCGGGMPQDVKTENIRAFIDTLKDSL